MRILVAYSQHSTFVQTTLDYLKAIKAYAGAEVFYVHVTHDAVMDFDFSGFDVVFHNYCARLCFEGYVSPHYCEAMRTFRGLKVLAVQDEYDRTNALKAAIHDLGFQVVLTCVPQNSLEYVYPKTEFPNVEFVTVFTGYVPEDFAAQHSTTLPLKERPITIGYRGRDIGGRYGRLGYDKFEIGRRMKRVCEERGIAHDIAMDENSRIYGTAWFDFIGQCRAMLGSESGSNVFDFDGSIEARYKTMAKERGGLVPYEEFLPIVSERDNAIEMGQISPRVFECAVMRTPMVLYRGRYSDAIKPDEHYIALEKDFSNIDEVLRRLEDIPALEAMTQRAYDHLVGSQAFGYRAFWQRLRPVMDRRIAVLNLPSALSKAQMSGLAPEETDSFYVERATVQPGSSQVFELKTLKKLIKIYADEVERLEKVLAEFMATTKGEVDRLENVYATERSHMETLFDPLPIAFHELPINTDSEGFCEAWTIIYKNIAVFSERFRNLQIAMEGYEREHRHHDALNAAKGVEQALKDRIAEQLLELETYKQKYQDYVYQANLKFYNLSQFSVKHTPWPSRWTMYTRLTVQYFRLLRSRSGRVVLGIAKLILLSAPMRGATLRVLDRWPSLYGIVRR